MKKIYHYMYTLDDRENNHPVLLKLDPPDPDEYADSCRDIFGLLDRHSFDVSNAVVRKLVDYAGRQIGNP